jgi:hypothetical protein
MSFAAGRLGWPTWTCDVDRYPVHWLGDHHHTHHAIDDARGYARLLVTLMSKSGQHKLSLLAIRLVTKGARDL